MALTWSSFLSAVRIYAKLAVILFLARMVGKTEEKRNSFLNLVFVIALVLPIVALVGTNNLSTAIIILGIAVIVVFVSDKDICSLCGSRRPEQA